MKRLIKTLGHPHIVELDVFEYINSEERITTQGNKYTVTQKEDYSCNKCGKDITTKGEIFLISDYSTFCSNCAYIILGELKKLMDEELSSIRDLFQSNSMRFIKDE